MTDLSDWVGRSRTEVEHLDTRLVRWMAATVDRVDLVGAVQGTVLPAGWHWAFFNTVEPRSRLGRDGHPRKGDFLPPAEQPRRMWAGSRLRWHGAFRAGAQVQRVSTIASCERKHGRSGTMVFVTVGHRFAAEGALLLEEEHDIVYRDDAGDAERAALAAIADGARAGTPAFERSGALARTIDPDPTMLFRYSAATFNGHRIHYDRDYARAVEGYPGLVVHGPLIATLLLDFVETEVAPGRSIEEFSFRAKRPTFDLSPFALHAERPDEQGRIALWSTNNVGEVAIDATARVT